jgi:hypothetical protein
VDDIELSQRDGLGIWDSSEVQFKAKTVSEVLVMEVPMSL